MQAENKAYVRSVSASGEANAYRFSVEISSPDLGCEQYADWWEVVDEDGELIYRRVLAHSHVSEQPFTRSGGPIDIDADQVEYGISHAGDTTMAVVKIDQGTMYIESDYLRDKIGTNNITVATEAQVLVLIRDPQDSGLWAISKWFDLSSAQ